MAGLNGVMRLCERNFRFFYNLPSSVVFSQISTQRLLIANSAGARVFPRQFLSADAQSGTGHAALPERSRSVFQSMVKFYDRYGSTGLMFHTVTAGISLAICWALVVSPNVDIPGIFAKAGFLSPLTLLIAKTSESFGTGAFAVAYILHKAIGPLRLLLTIIMTPILVRRYGPRAAIKIVHSGE